MVPAGSPVWLVLTFAIQYIAMFCSAILLGGLITCVSRLFSGRAATLREGLSNAGNHLIPLAGWTLLYAAFTTLQSAIIYLFPGEILPALLSAIPGILLGFLTIFVIPVIIIDGENLAGAIAGSVSLIRKTWGEILAYTFVYVVIGFMAALVSLIPAAAVGFPSGDAVILGITMALYMGVLILLAMISSTAVGIILVGLHTYARTGRIPAPFEIHPAEAVRS
jgi:hypothetical protein